MTRSDSFLVLAGVALAGASSSSAAQAAMYAASLRPGTPGVDSLVMTMFWAWVVTCAVAVVTGLAGGYLALRSGVIRQPLLLAFFLLYSLTLRVDNASLGWPWQLHIGMVLGRIGLGVNVIGVALLIRYLRAYNQPGVEPPSSAVEPSSGSEGIAAPTA